MSGYGGNIQNTYKDEGSNSSTSHKYRECKKCNSLIPRSILNSNHSICPNCGNYLRYHARRRIMDLADNGTFIEWKDNGKVSNPLKDDSYLITLENARNKHNLEEAVICGEIQIEGMKAVIGVMDTRFMMASMGHVVGERITRMFEFAMQRKLPVILYCCSGGARMQEGMISLMQMEKTAAAVKRHGESGLLYISVLTNPTMGGVTASFSMLADFVLAEKMAMIGFAGPRVIEQNTGKKLPKGFQTAEFQKEHGFVDAILEREKEKETLAFLLKFHLKKSKRKWKVDPKKRKEGEPLVKQTLSAWDRVMTARQLRRPTSLDYIENLFDDFFELSGDRVSGDDHAIIGGLATFNGMQVTVIGNQKGKNSVNDAVFRNWGMASPQGYRKALRLAKQAEKFNRPVVFFVDTIGAACDEMAEENGQAIAIANLLQEMSTIKVPVLSIIIGEGGSGGALALGVGNEVWMLENSIYSILTPEGYASIVWKDSSRAKDAANVMDLGAEDLYRLKIVDRVIKEEQCVTKENISCVCEELREEMKQFFIRFKRKSPSDIVKQRYRRFRKY